MQPTTRTPHQRDRRFARVRRLTQTVVIGSGVASGVFVGYAASVTKPYVAGSLHPAASTSASTPTTTPGSSGAGSSTPVVTPVSPAPTSAPTSAAPTCYSTPSGTTICN